MKRIALTVFIFCSLKCSSQNSFFNLYPFTLADNYGRINRIIPTHDNGLAGICSNGGVIKFDSTFQNSWRMHFQIPGYSFSPYDILELSNHDLMITGQIGKQGVINTYFLLRIDSSGNFLSMKVDSDSLNYSIGTFAGATDDGGFILSYLNSDTIPGAGSASKIDSTGNAVWTTAFLPDTNTWYNGYTISAATTADSCILIAGFYNYINNHNSPDYFSIIKLNSSGIPVWSKHSPDIGYTCSAYPPIEKNGSYYVFTIGDSTTTALPPPNLRKISALTGDLDWHTTYSDFAAFGDWSLIKTHDDRMIMMTRNDTLFASYSMAVEFDTAGNVSRNELYNYYVSNTSVDYGFFTMTETNTNTLVASGYEEDMTTNDLGYVLASLDTSFQTTCNSFYQNVNPPVQVSDTLISSGSAFSVSTSLLDITALVQTTTTVLSKVDFCNFVSVEENKFENAFNVSPNPTTGKLAIGNSQFAINEIIIYNLLGEKVLAVNGSALKTIDCGLLPSGIYILQATDGEKIWRAKVVKE